MNVPGVPDNIPWAKVRDFLESLGLDLRNMPAKHGGVEITATCIRATVYALNDKGERYADRSRPDEPRIATHQICIPITDGPWPATEHNEE